MGSTTGIWRTGSALFLVLALICISSCAGEPTARDELPFSLTEGVGIRLVAPGGTKLQRSFHLAPGEEFEAEITVRNNSDHRMDLLVTLLLDYQQVVFQWNGAQEVVHCFSVDKRGKESYTLRTEPLQEGYHEFILVFFWHPFYHSTSEKWRRRSGRIGWRRANLYVGDVSHPSKELPLYSGREVQNFVIPFFLTPQEVEEQPSTWCQESVEPGEVVNYFVYLGNSEREQMPFALVHFLNYRQIPPNPDADSMVTFGILPGYTNPEIAGFTQVNIPASFKAPEEPGLYELVILCVHQPYAMLENPPGVFDAPGYIASSHRTLIMVL